MSGYATTIWDVMRDAGEERAVAVEEAGSRCHAAVFAYARAAGLSEAEADGCARRVFQRVFDVQRLDQSRASGCLSHLLLEEARRELGERVGPAPEEFDRCWLAALLGSALLRLGERNPAEHGALRAFLGEERDAAAAARAMAAVDTDLRAVLDRARSRVARLLRDEIRSYTTSETEFLDEARRLAPLLALIPAR